jgi:hypothetical protein
VVACSSAAIRPQTEAGTPSLDAASEANNSLDDGGTLAFTPSLVLVDALVVGSATWAQGAFQLDDVRVCIHDQNADAKTFLTDHAQPYDRVIPLTNYVGLQNGSGIDLGPITAAAIDIDVYPASLLQGDAAWAPNDSQTCAKIACTDKGPTCVPHVRWSLALSGTVNVVALVDDTGGTGVKARVASFVDHAFDGQPNHIFGTVVDLSDWHSGETVGAYYGDWQTPGSGAALAVPLSKDTAASPMPIATTSAYEDVGLRFDETGTKPDTFGQSLDSIAFVADPTVTPPTFYGVRENFVFALVGDPTDASSVNAQGGRNPQFDRKGLHIAAVPYATPQPK